MFKPVEATPKFPDVEHKILKEWKKNKIFEKSVESRPADKPWTFLDGPPFVTGMPHYGSLLSSLPKDVFGRYWTMKGYRVRRVWGWDGHGLPIENKVENELGITRKKDIEEKVGIKTFIEHCKKYVADVSAEWEWYVDHIGRWVDFKHAYRTWDRDYMESVMWVFKQMYDKGYVYKGLRVSLYCPHCATPISNFEVAMDAENYKDVSESATTYKYKVAGEKETYFLAWSTTPWNKIVTPALAVNPKLDYVKVKQGDEFFILGKDTVKMLGDKNSYTVIDTVKGSKLVGQEFEPHYDYYKIEPDKRAFVIVGGDFVTEDEGTGIVTLAVYGEDDLALMQKESIQMVFHVDEEGMIKKDVPLFGSMYYLKANKAVNEDLQNRRLIYKDEQYAHSVAHCWRCATRLFYNPLTAWFINVQNLKDRMKKTNEQVNWYPNHFKHGRFLKSMECAPDWNISRNRYWGSPIPVWEDKSGHRFVPGSIAELERASGTKITDLHKPEIDEVTVACAACGQTMRRTPEVLDSWIEAGSASFAERHFPFNQNVKLEDFFPPDYIAEYTGQIRAWFYVLHVISTALYDSPAFKNVSVTGVIMGTDGRKMSKNFKNYPDPREMLNKYGADALRLYLLGSPVMKGEDILISEDAYRNQVKGMLLILWNVYKFFVTYANLTSFTPGVKWSIGTTSHVLDKWIVSRLNVLIREVTKDFDGYDTVAAIAKLNDFVQELSTWYLRRSRNRDDYYDTLHLVLVTFSQLLAPIAPFISEELYKNLTQEESVHLGDWPVSDASRVDEHLEKQMVFVRKIAEIGHAKRQEKAVAVKQPLASLTIVQTEASPKVGEDLLGLIKDELNVKKITFNIGKEESVGFDFTITEELKQEGEVRVIVRKIQEERKKLGTALDELVVVSLPAWPVKFEEEIKKKALVAQLRRSDSFKVDRI